MVTFGAGLLARTGSFTGRVTTMGKAVDRTAMNWQGKGATAASARAVSESLSATRIDDVVRSVAEYYRVYGTRLDETRTALLVIVDNAAPAAGMTVADDGTVTAPTYPRTGDVLVAGIMQARLTAQAMFFQAGIGALLSDFGDVEKQAAGAIAKGTTALQTLKQAPTAAIAALPAAGPKTYGRFTLGDPRVPHLKHDDTFLYDTEDASVGDAAAAAKWQGILRLGQMRTDLDDATALYNQYWQNNGKRTAFDYSEAYREDDAVRRNIDREVLVAAEAADGFAQDGRTSFRMTGGLMPREDISGPVTENWQKAIGGYQQWSHADVRVEGDRVTMDITVEAQDYYNFDKGKADQATGINDAENGRFAEIGWARPFDSYGSVTRTVSWNLGDPYSSQTDQGSQPEQNPGREDRTDGLGSSRELRDRRAPGEDVNWGNRETGRVQIE